MRQLPRRRYLALAGGTVATAGGVLAFGTQEASAKIEVEELSVPDEEHVLADEKVTDVRIKVECSFEWEGNAEITSYELRLKVGSTTDNAETLTGAKDTDLAKKELTGEETLDASILNSGSFDEDNFTPSNGEMRTDIALVLELSLYRDGTEVETAQATETATVTVSKEELEYTVELEGSGEISVESE